jgi:glycerol-3-phosphate dehydrogenase
MAEDCVDLLSSHFGLPKATCKTKSMLLQQTELDRVTCEQALEASQLSQPLHPKLSFTEANLLQGIRFEYACNLEDLLARRTRALFLNTTAALQIAPIAVKLLAQERRKDEAWESEQLRQFADLTQSYLL